MEVDRNLFEQLVFDVQRNKQTNGSKEYGFFFCSSRPRISKRKRAVEMIMDSLDSTQSVRSLTLSQGSPTRASRWMDGWMGGTAEASSTKQQVLLLLDGRRWRKKQRKKMW